ncbi:hypothetical protein [Streptomyces syringium]|uniref:hypothetical protein n=1 Tax=Streptomyces syringium TaxID=76729 RepID=UPI00343ED00D
MAAVFLGTAALLGALATPASAGSVDTTVASVVATTPNALTGAQSAVGNLTTGR